MDVHVSPLFLKTQVKNPQQNCLVIQILHNFPKRRNTVTLSPRKQCSVLTYTDETRNTLSPVPSKELHCATEYKR